ncbi:MAG: aminotransferase class I/II-fold pyridoxal phosphate-dependent enzyme [Planctomycetota bacterium]
MPAPVEQRWQATLERLAERGLGRTLIAQVEGPDYLSNDLFGLSQHPEVVQAAAQAARLYGVGSRASRLLGGDHGLVLQAEAAAAAWIGTESALLFPSGYQANVGLLQALCERGDVIFSDALNHASIIDGARLAGAACKVYAHGDCAELRRLIERTPCTGQRWIVTESLFSMDGDLAPLAELAEVCRETGARLLIDEAHAAGLLGERGRGACSEVPGIEDVLAARVVTGGKTLGVAGAFVLGSGLLRRYLLHRARSFVFTTGIALPLAAALTRAIGLVQDMDAARDTVREGARHLARLLELPEPAGAVVPIPVGSEVRALELAALLRDQDLTLHAVRPPTVPRGGSRLRVVVHSGHKPEDLERIAKTARPYLAPLAAPMATIGRPWVVIGTDTDAGKTVACALLLHSAARNGACAYWKAMQSGLPADSDTIRRLTADLPVTVHNAGMTFALPLSPDQAAAQKGGASTRRDRCGLRRHLVGGPHPSSSKPLGACACPGTIISRPSTGCAR